MAKSVLICLSVFLLGCFGAFVDDDKVLEAVRRAGYDNPVVVKKHYIAGYYGCSRDDNAAYDIEALNSHKEKVKFVACAGWPFKSVTIRF